MDGKASGQSMLVVGGVEVRRRIKCQHAIDVALEAANNHGPDKFARAVSVYDNLGRGRNVHVAAEDVAVPAAEFDHHDQVGTLLEPPAIDLTQHMAKEPTHRGVAHAQAQARGVHRFFSHV